MGNDNEQKLVLKVDSSGLEKRVQYFKDQYKIMENDVDRLIKKIKTCADDIKDLKDSLTYFIDRVNRSK